MLPWWVLGGVDAVPGWGEMEEGPEMVAMMQGMVQAHSAAPGPQPWVPTGPRLWLPNKHAASPWVPARDRNQGPPAVSYMWPLAPNLNT